jgi:hypothetical protein
MVLSRTHKNMRLTETPARRQWAGAFGNPKDQHTGIGRLLWPRGLRLPGTYDDEPQHESEFGELDGKDPVFRPLSGRDSFKAVDRGTMELRDGLNRKLDASGKSRFLIRFLNWSIGGVAHPKTRNRLKTLSTGCVSGAGTAPTDRALSPRIRTPHLPPP